MAARLNITSGAFPVTPQLVYNLVIAFCVFNQALLKLLAIALVQEQRADTAGRFALASAILALGVFAMELIWQWRASVKRGTDVAVFVVAGIFAAADAWLLLRASPGAAAIAGIVSTATVAIWQSRGVVRKWIGGGARKLRAEENNESR